MSNDLQRKNLSFALEASSRRRRSVFYELSNNHNQGLRAVCINLQTAAKDSGDPVASSSMPRNSTYEVQSPLIMRCIQSLACSKREGLGFRVYGLGF